MSEEKGRGAKKETSERRRSIPPDKGSDVHFLVSEIEKRCMYNNKMFNCSTVMSLRSIVNAAM